MTVRPPTSPWAGPTASLRRCPVYQPRVGPRETGEGHAELVAEVGALLTLGVTAAVVSATSSGSAQALSALVALASPLLGQAVLRSTRPSSTSEPSR